MRATELITQLAAIIAEHGDVECAVYDCGDPSDMGNVIELEVVKSDDWSVSFVENPSKVKVLKIFS